MAIQQRVRTAFKTGSVFPRATHFVYGKLLFALPQSVRRGMFEGKQYYCPICASHLREFLPLYRSYHRWCPVCQSLARHRFVWHYFQQAALPKGGQDLRVLHVAPEEAIQRFLQALPGVDYLSGDIENKKAMVRLDICNIDFPGDSFDLIFCSHVLEHVVDDHQALREFLRVLSPEGQLMLMVPIMGEVTVEDPSVTDPVERERLYGQLDHVRAYGSDFPDIVRSVGFEVQTFKPEDFINSIEIQKQGIDSTDRLFVCTPRL